MAAASSGAIAIGAMTISLTGSGERQDVIGKHEMRATVADKSLELTQAARFARCHEDFRLGAARRATDHGGGTRGGDRDRQRRKSV